MKISDFDYKLPPELIAQYPPEIRGEARLLVLDRATKSITHKSYADVIDYLNPGDVLVLNDTRVVKARLLAEKASGGKVELLVLEKHAEQIDLHLQPVLFRGNLITDETLNLDRYLLQVTRVDSNGIAYIDAPVSLFDLADSLGHVPIPPYLKRPDEALDVERYQTQFAKIKGSVAAPTASLNMTNDLIEKIKQKGIKICYVTLHVGLGTFLPVREDEVEKHQIHTEYYQIPTDTIETIRTAKTQGRKVIAIGTTVTRCLEDATELILKFDVDLQNENDAPSSIVDGISSCAGMKSSEALAKEGEADIFIYPGYQFKIVDQLLTNFHAPRSTVLLLAAAFAGTENLRTAYAEAINEKYRFLSYGDSMLML